MPSTYSLVLKVLLSDATFQMRQLVLCLLKLFHAGRGLWMSVSHTLLRHI